MPSAINPLLNIFVASPLADLAALDQTGPKNLDLPRLMGGLLSLLPLLLPTSIRGLP